MGKFIRIPQLKKLKKKTFKAKREYIEQQIGIQLTLISKEKLQNQDFLAKYDSFLGDIYVHFEPMLGWEYAYVCHD